VEGERVGVTYEPGRLGEALAGLDLDALAEMQRRGRDLALSRLNAEAQTAVLGRAWRP
jgi:hypothetical protein